MRTMHDLLTALNQYVEAVVVERTVQRPNIYYLDHPIYKEAEKYRQNQVQETKRKFGDLLQEFLVDPPPPMGEDWDTVEGLEPHKVKFLWVDGAWTQVLYSHRKLGGKYMFSKRCWDSEPERKIYFVTGDRPAR